MTDQPHRLATVPLGMHHSLGFSQVRGGGAIGSAAASIETDRTDAMTWLAPGGTWAGGETALVVDSSAWSAFGVLAWRFGSTAAPGAYEFNVDDALGRLELIGSGDLRLSSQIRMNERVGDPTGVLNAGFLYTKDDAGTTELYFRSSDGTVHQLTPASAGGGGDLDDAYDFGGAGAGRTITADSGAVVIAGAGGLNVEGDVVLTDTTSEIYSSGADGYLRLRGNRSASSTTADVIIASQATRTAGSIAAFANVGNTRLSVEFDGAVVQAGGSRTTGIGRALVIAPAAWSGQTAGTEIIAVSFDLSHTVTHNSNTAIATQRDLLVQATTHAFVTAGGVITDGATLAIAGPPVAGTNATITNPLALWVQSGTTRLTGSLIVNSGSIDLDPTGTFALDMDAGQTATVTISDNLSAAFVVQEGANRYIEVTTLNSDGEYVQIGNAALTGYLRASASAVGQNELRVASGTNADEPKRTKTGIGSTTAGGIDVDIITIDVPSGYAGQVNVHVTAREGGAGGLYRTWILEYGLENNANVLTLTAFNDGDREAGDAIAGADVVLVDSGGDLIIRCNSGDADPLNWTAWVDYHLVRDS